MDLVIDTNKIIAALIKDGASRSIITDPQHRFYAPEFSLVEIHKYEDLIVKKSGMRKSQVRLVLELLAEHITIVPKTAYADLRAEADKQITDKDDLPFVALALAKNIGIWTDDKDFQSVTSVPVFTTAYLLD